jgi:hypothetical protein
MIRLSSILLALAALGTGLLAAYKWYKASKVQIDLGYTYPGSQAGETYRRMGMELTRSPEPMEAELKQMNEISATWEAMNEAAKLNKVAAAWIAASVALGALSTIVGTIA